MRKYWHQVVNFRHTDFKIEGSGTKTVICAWPARPTYPPGGTHPSEGWCPPPQWAETNCPSVINQLPARASPLLFMTEATSMTRTSIIWASSENCLVTISTSSEHHLTPTSTSHFDPFSPPSASCSWKLCARGPRQPLITPRFYHCHQPKPKTCPTNLPFSLLHPPENVVSRARVFWQNNQLGSQKKSMRGILTDVRFWGRFRPNCGISHKCCW